MLYILVMFIALLFNIVAHELAHFASARIFGYPVHRIQFGLGPELMKFGRREGTACRICLFPIGGCFSYDPKAAPSASTMKQCLITAAGPFTNVLLAALFFALHRYYGQQPHSSMLAVQAFDGYFCFLIAFTSASCGFWNLLPIPPLDGGVLLLLGVECFRKRPIEDATAALITNMGTCFVSVSTLIGVAATALWVFR